jgi:hypothetical protein
VFTYSYSVCGVYTELQQAGSQEPVATAAELRLNRLNVG